MNYLIYACPFIYPEWRTALISDRLVVFTYIFLYGIALEAFNMCQNEYISLIANVP